MYSILVYSSLVLFHFCLIQLYLFYFVHIRLKCPRSVRTYVTWILSGPNFRCVNSKSFDTQLLDPSIKDINDHSRSNSYYLVPNIMHKKDLSLGYPNYIFVFRSNLWSVNRFSRNVVRKFGLKPYIFSSIFWIILTLKFQCAETRYPVQCSAACAGECL